MRSVDVSIDKGSENKDEPEAIPSTPSCVAGSIMEAASRLPPCWAAALKAEISKPYFSKLDAFVT
jgi:hypothetical protein